jgi:serine/threonine protein kinase
MTEPRMFGDYALSKLLGSGGFAEVHLADLRGIEGFSKRVALKILHDEASSDLDALGRFIVEARLLSSLIHPNIVQVHQLGQFERRYFIAMEYVPGTNLAALLRRLEERDTQLPTAVCVAIVVAVLEGLHHAHEKLDGKGQPLGIVHRDVSPDNVLLSTDGSVKLTDFGIAKLTDSNVRTRTGELKGKFAYMAPEQASGKSVDRRVDVFAAGAILYETLTGKALRTGSEVEMLQQAQRADLPSLAEVPKILRPILAKALASDRDLRFASALELEKALRAAVPLAGARELLTTLVAGEIPLESPRTRHSLKLALTAAFGLCVLAVTAFVLARWRHETAAPNRVPTSQETPPPLPTPPTPAPAIESPAGVGFVSINAKPWAVVSIDGTVRGNTPLVRRPLREGFHDLHLEYPPKGRKITRRIEIREGETFSLIHDFTKDFR